MRESQSVKLKDFSPPQAPRPGPRGPRLADLQMLGRLDDVRLYHVETTDEGLRLARADSLYEAAFRDYGIDVDASEPAELAAAINRRAISPVLVSALDNWARNTPGPRAEAGSSRSPRPPTISPTR